MKKLLGIVVLGLLLSGNAYAVSQDDIINQHLKNRKLDPIEGIWVYDIGADESSAVRGAWTGTEYRLDESSRRAF